MAADVTPLLKYLGNAGSDSPIKHIRVSKDKTKIICLLASPYEGTPRQTYYIERRDDSSARVIGNKAIDCHISTAEKIANEMRVNIMSDPLGRFFGINSSEEGVLTALMDVYNSENMFNQNNKNH